MCKQCSSGKRVIYGMTRSNIIAGHDTCGGDRMHKCECGLEIDRDYNSAMN